MNSKGFTLIESLIAFTCVLIGMLLCGPIISSFAYMQKPSYLSEDRLAVYQLRLLLAQSNHLTTGYERIIIYISKKTSAFTI